MYPFCFFVFWGGGEGYLDMFNDFDCIFLEFVIFCDICIFFISTSNFKLF